MIAYETLLKLNSVNNVVYNTLLRINTYLTISGKECDENTSDRLLNILGQYQSLSTEVENILQGIMHNVE